MSEGDETNVELMLVRAVFDFEILTPESQRTPRSSADQAKGKRSQSYGGRVARNWEHGREVPWSQT